MRCRPTSFVLSPKRRGTGVFKSRMTFRGGYWREAASLILAAQDHSRPSTNGGIRQSDACDFSVLMLKRSRKSTFLSEKMVFPGGVVDDADFHEDWKPILEAGAGESFAELASKFRVSGERAPIFTRHHCFEHHLSPELALRIAAIRETFEEAGVLLLKPIGIAAQVQSDKLSTDRTDFGLVSLHMLPKSAGLGKWRQRVRKDPAAFLMLCRELKAVPNVWALKEWSNWLTPASETMKKPPEKPHRFDTMFYICCLDRIVRVIADRKEVYSPKWLSPAEVLRMSKIKTPEGISIIEPQILELSRLQNFSSVKYLCTFATQRQERGVHRTQTVPVLCSDGHVGILTGDDECPKDLDPTKSSLCSTEETIVEFRARAKHLNRIEWPHMTGGDTGPPVYCLVCNVALNGHSIPFRDENDQTATGATSLSKL